jgi:hypothetical protein
MAPIACERLAPALFDTSLSLTHGECQTMLVQTKLLPNDPRACVSNKQHGESVYRSDTCCGTLKMGSNVERVNHWITLSAK